MIKENYVSFETAKLLKEKGFDENISMIYTSYGDLCKLDRYDSICNSNYNDITKNYFEYTAPTLQMAMRWLRELKRCIIVIIPKWFTPYGCAKYAYSIWADDNLEIDGETDKDTEYDTYEKTCEEAIKYCLKNLI